jgi:pimeloyl-ACP methyl ester carboxylesterase
MKCFNPPGLAWRRLARASSVAELRRPLANPQARLPQTGAVSGRIRPPGWLTLWMMLGAALNLPGAEPAAALPRPAALTWPGETIDQWHGFKRHQFVVDGCRAWVVEPARPLPGQPWSWCLEFPDAFTDRCAAPALLAQGFHHAHVVVGNTFGSPEAMQHMDAFHASVTARGLAPKAALIGLSRGGLYAYRWAARNPGKVSVIYGDAPVCDFKSWPGGKGQGKGSPADWAALFKCYGFKDETEALAWPGNPIDTLEPLAKAKVALIHVVGDADDVVPVAENTALVEARYRALGGVIRVIHKPGIGHHPHGLDDPTPVVAFIRDHTAP